MYALPLLPRYTLKTEPVSVPARPHYGKKLIRGIQIIRGLTGFIAIIAKRRGALDRFSDLFRPTLRPSSHIHTRRLIMQLIEVNTLV